jgi:hypothetical protein
VLLNWRDSIGAATYAVGRSTVSGGPYAVIATVTGTNYSDNAVIANQVYYYVIAGENGLGVGPYSTEISIKAGNRLPVAAADVFRVDEDTSALLQPMINDSDPDGDPLTLELLSQPATGVATVTTNGFVLYATAPDFVGTNNFAYRIHDGRGGYATGAVMVIVVPVNDPPTAVPTDFVVPGNTRSTRQLQGTDIDSTQLRFFLTRVPEHGLAGVDQNSGQLFYQPAHGFFGIDTLGFMVTDGQTNSAEATARLFVERPADLDGDGMDDAWENFWDLNNPLNDPDGDGVINRDEYFANTSPRDPNSVLHILNVRHDPQGRSVISWSSVGGTRYRIFIADQLTGTATSDFREIIRSTPEEIDPAAYGTASVQTFVDTTPPPQSGRRFYRIGVAP